MGIAMAHTCMDIGVRYPFVLFMNIIRFLLLQKVLLGQGNLQFQTRNGELFSLAAVNCFEPSLSPAHAKIFCSCSVCIMASCTPLQNNSSSAPRLFFCRLKG